MITRYKCAVCGKLTDGRLPKEGDGSFYYPRRHKGINGQPCPGNVIEAEWVEVDRIIYYKEKKNVTESRHP